MEASRKYTMRERSALAILLFALLLPSITGFFACKRGPENSSKASPQWKVSRDHHVLLDAIIDTIGPGREIIFFSSHSFFEDFVGRNNGRSITILWVVPDRRDITQEKIDGLLGYFKKKFVKSKEVNDAISLKLDGEVVKGRIGRIDIRIMNIDTFNASEATVAFDSTVFAESAFPYPLYRNEVSTPMVRLVLTFGSRLVDFLSQGGSVYLLDNDRILPPKYRYFTRYITEILANPGMVGQDIPRAWWLRANAEYLESFFQLEESLKNYLQARDINADDPAIWYQIAYLQAKTGKEGYGDNLRKSYGLEKSFYDGYLDIALLLAKDGKTDKALALLDVARKLRPDDPRRSEIQQKIREGK